MHIALIGSSGFVGSEFVQQIKKRNFKLSKITRQDCSFKETDELTRILKKTAPDYLINCAGYTGKPNVDACERDKAACLFGNAVLPAIVAECCKDLAIPWGHVSSGCIYSGRKLTGEPFTEFDSPNFSFRQNNCSFYSGSKALGEEILEDFGECYIWRLRIPFSKHDSDRNYLSKLLRYDRLLDAENSLSHLGEFVSAALDCFEMSLPFGKFNLTNPGGIYTREVVEKIKATIAPKKQFRFFQSNSEFMQMAACTPRSNCVLDSQKALNFGLHLSPIHQILEDCLESWSWDHARRR